MVNNVLRDFRIHAKRAGIQFNGEFTIHTFRKSCAQNWADRLPANVVKFYLGHSKLETTNRFYSIVDESHMAWTKQAMDELLNAKRENHLDTEQTLTLKNDRKVDAKNKAANMASFITPPHKSTSETAQDWAVLDLNQ